jgi:uncharacterized lipoprotein
MTIPSSGPRRRKALFRNIYRNYVAWGQLIETEGPIRSVITVDGEDIDYYDLMVGYKELPPRQKQAFTLQLLQGYTERQASRVMFPESTCVTSVQQYSSNALDRMIQAYDRVQTRAGRRKQNKVVERGHQRRRRAARKAVSSKYEIRPPDQSTEFISRIRRELFD